MASTIFCIIDIARQKNEAEPKDVVKRKLVSTTMNDMNEIQIIQSKIYEVRGRRVMLDTDLAELQAGKQERRPRKRIGFIQDEE